MLKACGFNGFGQFGADLQRKVFYEEVKGIDLNALTNDEVGILAIGAWQYAAFGAGSKLFVQGFLMGKPNSKLTFTTTEPIKQLAACDAYCLVLLNSGKLLKFVPNVGSSLQEVKFANLEEDCVAPETLLRKRNIFGEFRSNLKCSKITHIACGAKLACAVSSTNGIYNIPSKIYQLPTHLRVQQLVCGFEHAILLSTNGDVYAWGNGIRGQLGQELLGLNEIPTLMEALAGMKMIYIAAGGWHSAAISAFGDLYTWGFNSNGQLGLKVFEDINGLKSPSVYTLPQLVNVPICCGQNDRVMETAEFRDECMPLKVFCGSRHMVLQMSCGTLFASGWNAYGQLGLKCKNDFVDQLHRVSLDAKDINIICSAWCTIFKMKNELHS